MENIPCRPGLPPPPSQFLYDAAVAHLGAESLVPVSWTLSNKRHPKSADLSSGGGSRDVNPSPDSAGALRTAGEDPDLSPRAASGGGEGPRQGHILSCQESLPPTKVAGQPLWPQTVYPAPWAAFRG